MQAFMPGTQPWGTYAFDPASSSSQSATQMLNTVNAEQDGAEDQVDPLLDSLMDNLPASVVSPLDTLITPNLRSSFLPPSDPSTPSGSTRPPPSSSLLLTVLPHPRPAQRQDISMGSVTTGSNVSSSQAQKHKHNASKHQRVRLMIWIQLSSPMPLIQLSTAWQMWWRGLLMHLLTPLPLPPPFYCHFSHWLSTYSALISTLSTFIGTCILSWNSWSSYLNYISWWLWFNRGWIVCCLSILYQCIGRCCLCCTHFYCSWRQPVSEISLPSSPTRHSRSSSRKGQAKATEDGDDLSMVY